MKIIYVSSLHPSQDETLNIGGTQTVSLQLLRAFQACPEIEIVPILLQKPREAYIPEIAGFWLRLLLQLPFQVRAINPDLVFFISMETASLAPFLRFVLPVPLIALTHGHDVIWALPPYQRLVPHILRNLDGVISVSAATRQAALSRGLHEQKSYVIPNAILVDQERPFDSVQSRQWLSERVGMDCQPRSVLLSVGRQVKRKGHEWFIRQVVPKLPDSVVYVLVGDGAESEAIAQSIDEMQLGDRVFQLGRLSAEGLQHCYDAADLFIMPNIPKPGDMEGFGIVMLEANEARTPAIASRLEGMTDVIAEDVNGYTVPALDSDAFVSAIKTSLGPEYQALAERSYHHVVQQYQWPAIAQQYLSVFRRFL